MQIYTIRLKEGDELRSSLMNFAKENNLTAASILTCVGSINQANIRMADAAPARQDIREYSDPYEIVSLVGTFDGENCHIHIALSDTDGQVVGGHLKSVIVHTTAEIVVLNDETKRYVREMDKETGFIELSVKEKNV